MSDQATPDNLRFLYDQEEFLREALGKLVDTPAFAVAPMRRWREEMGKSRYPEARELFITADASGSNGHRSRAWKHELQQFADETGCASTSATSRRAPASGTRLNIVCSVISHRIGGASRCGPLRP